VISTLASLLLFALGSTSSFAVDEVKPKEDGAIKILFLGDSLTEGYGISKEKAYPVLVQDGLNAYFTKRRMGKRVEVINAGVSGSTSASALSRLRWFLKRKPKVLFLAMGSNDGLRGVPIPEMEKNLDATLALAQREGMKIVIAGMKLPPNYGPERRAEFEGVFSRLAKKYEASLLPFLLVGVGGEKELNIEDGAHPNEKGHRKIAETVQPYLEKIL
jgi:acyl-CoA thioesterase-1